MILRSHSGITLLILATTACGAAEPDLHAPADETYAKHDPHGLTILVNSRYRQPIGRHLPFARFP